MSLKLKTYSSRPGKSGFVKKILSRLAMRNLKIFPVPGRNSLITKGFNPFQKGVEFVASPKHANVLLVSAPIPEEMAKNAAVVYAQMPRPRVLIFADLEKLPPLPEPDLQISSSELNELPKLLQGSDLWNTESESFEPEFLTEILEEDEDSGGHEHHQHNQDDDSQDDEGENPEDQHKSHQQHEQASGEDEKEEEKHKHHQHMDHGKDDESEDSGDHQHMRHGEDEDENDDEDEHEHHDHGGHDHGGGGFMSMVMMTKDMPRSPDGLPMDTNEVRFGPFHPGLPDGLRIKMTLDGDTVRSASYEKGLFERNFEKNFPQEPEKLPEYLSKLDPFQTETYRQLGLMALRQAAGKKDFPLNAYRIEKERIENHLLFFYTLFRTLGDKEMERKTAEAFRHFQKQKTAAAEIKNLLKNLQNRLYLKQRLQKTGMIPESLLHHLSGPVAKAAGIQKDERVGSPFYRNIEPIALEENNAWGKFLVRLKEIEQSLELMDRLSDQRQEEKISPLPKEATGTTTLEGANGKLCLDIKIEDGKINYLKLNTPSVELAALIPEITKETELADALTGICSLGISPWELEK